MSLSDELGRRIAAERRDIERKLLLRRGRELADGLKEKLKTEMLKAEITNPNAAPEVIAACNPFPNGRWS
jgi:hypothetical protein